MAGSSGPAGQCSKSHRLLTGSTHRGKSIHSGWPNSLPKKPSQASPPIAIVTCKRPAKLGCWHGSYHTQMVKQQMCCTTNCGTCRAAVGQHRTHVIAGSQQSTAKGSTS